MLFIHLRILCSQLFYDGQANLAKNIAGMAKITDMCPPSDKLFTIVSRASRAERGKIL